jgi:predicted house-cleaning noncanonical NTP pyrophosphatase (MazG superfamily)
VRTTYGKLIRDRIPEILEAEGLRYEIGRLDDEAFKAALLAKLVEEAGEAADAADADALARELADLYEVIDAVIELHGLDPAAVRALQARRREERGGFERRLALRWTEG